VIVDRYGRQFKNLRVSLTAACNYACTYCVPHGEKRHSAKYELSEEHLIRAVTLIRLLTNVNQLRITGGEPLISPKFESFLSSVSRQYFTDISITTNGQLLADKADFIASCGIRRINVSLDTLDPHAFRSISKAGDLFSVLMGIEKCLALGLKIKINMVPLRRLNSDQVIPLLNYCLDRNIELRYIELMRMGHLANSTQFDRDFMPMSHILAEIGRHYEFARVDSPFDSTSIKFEISGRGNFGVIANESEPFCSSCTRLRLSSSGYLHGCLSSNQKHYIGDILDFADDEALTAMSAYLHTALGDKQMVFQGGETVMRLIGG
jgi:cyclic pyranopterin phosphate synthase